MKYLNLILLVVIPVSAQITPFPFPTGGSGGCVTYDSFRSVVWYAVEGSTNLCKFGAGGSPNTCFLAPSNVATGGCAYSASDDKVYLVLQNVGGTTDEIVQFDPKTNTFTATWNIPEGVAGTAGIIAFNGSLYCVETSANKVCKVSLSGSFSTSITVGSFPHGPSIGPNGKLRFALYSGNKIGQIDTSDAYTEVSLPQAGSHPAITTPCTLQGTAGICFTINTPNGSSTVGQLGFMPDSNQTQGAISTVNIPCASPDAWGITTGADGNVYFGERGCNKVGIWNMATGQINNEWLLPSSGQSPNKLCLAFNNQIVLTEHITNNIDVFNFTPTFPRSGAMASLMFRTWIDVQ